jgi:hypothetical protein
VPPNAILEDAHWLCCLTFCLGGGMRRGGCRRPFLEVLRSCMGRSCFFISVSS